MEDKKTNLSACNIKKTSIGGQALIEGVMMRGPEKTAMAVRNDTTGEITLEEWKTPAAKFPKLSKLPFVRGIFNFVDSLRFGYKCLMRSAELSGLEEEQTDEEKAAWEAMSAEERVAAEAKKKKQESALMSVLMIVASVLGIAIALVLFMWLPIRLFRWLCAAIPALDDPVVRGIFEGVLRIVIFLVYMLLVSLMKDIRRTFEYHGAEHKTIFCYEKGMELTVENVRTQRRFHPRCGTSFMILMLLVGVIISILIPISTPWLRTVVKLALIPLTVGIGYELIKLAGRKDNVITRIISAPGMWLQHVTTREPDDSMIECAIAALRAVIPEDPEADRW